MKFNFSVFVLVVALSLLSVPTNAAGIPGLDEYTHTCVQFSDDTVSISFDLDGGFEYTRSRGAFLYDGTEVSCDWAWATCSGYGDCER